MENTRNAFKILIGKHEEKKPFGRQGSRREDDIKMDIKVRGCEQALDGSEWSDSRIGRFIPREKRVQYQLDGSWVRPRSGLNTEVRRKIN
jgi:hypothetical protein